MFLKDEILEARKFSSFKSIFFFRFHLEASFMFLDDRRYLLRLGRNEVEARLMCSTKVWKEWSFWLKLQRNTDGVGDQK
jgi:hypothetical protein